MTPPNIKTWEKLVGSFSTREKECHQDLQDKENLIFLNVKNTQLRRVLPKLRIQMSFYGHDWLKQVLQVPKKKFEI